MEIVLKAALEEARLRAGKRKRQSGAYNSEPSPDFLSAIVDAPDSKGRTPLNFATRMNFPVHAELRTSYGANQELSTSRTTNEKSKTTIETHQRPATDPSRSKVR